MRGNYITVSKGRGRLDEVPFMRTCCVPQTSVKLAWG